MNAEANAAAAGHAAAAARSRSSDAERFAAAAAVLLAGVVEAETLVQAFAHEIQFGAVEIRQALRVDQDLDAVALELLVLGVGRIGVFELVGHAGAAGGTHAEGHADPFATA